MNTATTENVVRIKIAGVGGGGSNALDRMMKADTRNLEV